MKRAVTLLLLVVMIASLLVGCGTTATTAATTTDAKAAETEKPKVDTTILMEQDDNMINTYTLIAVNPDAPFADADGKAVENVSINTAGAQALIDWMLSQEGLDAAAKYGYDKYGDYLFYIKDDAPKYTGEIAKATDTTKTVRLSTTTSVNDSGLLDYLLPIFEKEYGYTVEVQSAGTGKAIAAAQYGNADAILVHAKAKEEAFVKAGFAYVLPGFDSERLSFMYNYFVLCGPSADPAGVKTAKDAKEAFQKIADGKYKFISRGDGSGTHVKELSLWPESLGITEDASSYEKYSDWYVSANAGMGACLVMAEQMGAYILTDKATYLTFYSNGGVVNS